MWPLDAEPDDVERRQENQGEHGRDREAAHDRVGHGTPENGRRDRRHAEDHRLRGQDDRTETHEGGFDHGIPTAASGILLGFDLIHQAD